MRINPLNIKRHSQLIFAMSHQVISCSLLNQFHDTVRGMGMIPRGLAAGTMKGKRPNGMKICDNKRCNFVGVTMSPLLSKQSHQTLTVAGMAEVFFTESDTTKDVPIFSKVYVSSSTTEPGKFTFSPTGNPVGYFIQPTSLKSGTITVHPWKPACLGACEEKKRKAEENADGERPRPVVVNALEIGQATQEKIDKAQKENKDILTDTHNKRKKSDAIKLACMGASDELRLAYAMQKVYTMVRDEPSAPTEQQAISAAYNITRNGSWYSTFSSQIETYCTDLRRKPSVEAAVAALHNALVTFMSNGGGMDATALDEYKQRAAQWITDTGSEGAKYLPSEDMKKEVTALFANAKKGSKAQLADPVLLHNYVWQYGA